MFEDPLGYSPIDEYFQMLANFWIYSDWFARAIFIGLALMLGYVLFILVRFFLRYYSARSAFRDTGEEPGSDLIRERRQIIADLSRGLGNVKAISSIAPFLVLAGTTYHATNGFETLAVSKSVGLAAVAGGIAFAVVGVVAGVLVATTAVFVHNILVRWIENLRLRSINDPNAPKPGRTFRRAQSLRLQKRISTLPPFALLAVPVLACVVFFLMTLSPSFPKGLRVSLPSTHCDDRLLQPPDRLVVLQIKNSGRAFINVEPEEWKDLRRVLGDIYGARQQRVLYLLAEDEVPFQTVADALDIAKNLPASGKDSLDMKVILLTPKASKECVPLLVRIMPTK